MKPTQAQIESALIRLCNALLRQNTELDGNWGHPEFHSEVAAIKDELTAAADRQQLYTGAKVVGPSFEDAEMWLIKRNENTAAIRTLKEGK